MDDSRQSPRYQYDGPLQDAVYSPPPLLRSEKLIGSSDALYRLFDAIGAALQGTQNVLIQGETGTGKNLVARTLHSQSERSEHWLIVVNCEVIEPRDLPSLLLGPSSYSSKGILEAASGGTLLFDHVDRLAPAGQARLNHILETHSFDCASTGGPSALDIRLLFLTSQELPGTDFRDDLYHKLNQFPIRVPPLRERPGDILPLARHFLRHGDDPETPQGERSFSSEANSALRRYDWPGNIRELRNTVEWAGAVSETPTIEKSDLPSAVRNPTESSPDDEPASQATDTKDARENSDAASDALFGTSNGEIPEIEELKREAVKRAYNLCEGNVDQAAVELGIARSTMYRLLKKYDLK